MIPTTLSPRPREKSISVAAGKKEAIRKGRVSALAAALATLHSVIFQVYNEVTAAPTLENVYRYLSEGERAGERGLRGCGKSILAQA